MYPDYIYKPAHSHYKNHSLIHHVRSAVHALTNYGHFTCETNMASLPKVGARQRKLSLCVFPCRVYSLFSRSQTNFSRKGKSQPFPFEEVGLDSYARLGVRKGICSIATQNQDQLCRGSLAQSCRLHRNSPGTFSSGDARLGVREVIRYVASVELR